MELIIFIAVIAAVIGLLCRRKTKPEDLYNELYIKDRAITGRQPENYIPNRRY